MNVKIELTDLSFEQFDLVKRDADTADVIADMWSDHGDRRREMLCRMLAEYWRHLAEIKKSTEDVLAYCRRIDGAHRRSDHGGWGQGYMSGYQAGYRDSQNGRNPQY